MLGSAAKTPEVNQFLMTVAQFLQLLNRKDNAEEESWWNTKLKFTDASK